MATNKAARKSLKRIEAYQALFSTADGTLVLEDLMQTHHMLSSTYTGDATQILIREGERNVVLRILTILKTNPKQLLERIEQHEKDVE